MSGVRFPHPVLIAMTNKTRIITCHDVRNNKFKIESDKLSFRPSVYGILIDNDRILLSKHWDGYDLPGGGMEIHETIDETLEREFFEETGLRVKPLFPAHCETSFFHPSHSKKKKNEYWNCTLIYYAVEKIGGDISKDNFDEDEKEYADLPEWIDLAKIDKIKFFNSIEVLKVIKKAIDFSRY